jgi:hypothetical protein
MFFGKRGDQLTLSIVEHIRKKRRMKRLKRFVRPQ